MIYELNHVGGPVRDLDASLAFYSGIGAEVVDRLFMAGSRTHRVHIQLATGLVELLHNENADPETTYGLNHVGFMTDDLDDAAVEFYGEHLGMERVPTDEPDVACFRIGADAVKLCKSAPPANTPVNHLGLAVAEPRPDSPDPDGNRITFLPDFH